MEKQRTKRRQTLVQENKTLKETIKSLQDENGNLIVSNHDLDKNNAILNERLSNFGVRDLCKTLGSFGLGTAIGNLQNNQFLWAAITAIISGIVLLGFSVYDNLLAIPEEKGEKVRI